MPVTDKLVWVIQDDECLLQVNYVYMYIVPDIIEIVMQNIRSIAHLRYGEVGTYCPLLVTLCLISDGNNEYLRHLDAARDSICGRTLFCT